MGVLARTGLAVRQCWVQELAFGYGRATDGRGGGWWDVLNVHSVLYKAMMLRVARVAYSCQVPCLIWGKAELCCFVSDLCPKNSNLCVLVRFDVCCKNRQGRMRSPLLTFVSRNVRPESVRSKEVVCRQKQINFFFFPPSDKSIDGR
jgi:hypothetical protein